MNSSFYNGISGIKSYQFGIDVVADNISNINNTGFKSSSPEFSSVFSTTMIDMYESGSTNNQSYGSKAQTNALNLSQGTLVTTENVFDLAIQGEGWFGVLGQNSEQYFTRAGDFSLDANNDLVNGNGQYLLGTSANNLTQTTLEQETLQNYGYSYIGDTRSLVDVYSVSMINDIDLSSVDNQGKITLPDFLYTPPIPSSNITFKANLDPTITTELTDIEMLSSNYSQSVTPTDNNITINGTITQSELDNINLNDPITLTFTDINGKSINATTYIDGDTLTWNLNNYNVSELDTSSDLEVSASIKSLQEISNVEHFSSTVIGEDGTKDILDLTFTKQVPQETTGTTWDLKANIYSFYEDYVVEQYDPTKIYDEDIYNVDTIKKQVTKIYDENEYYIDTSTDKVYNIIDSQIGSVSFNGSGALSSLDIPTLANGSTPLTLDFGTLASSETITDFTQTIEDDALTLSGTLSDLIIENNITITATDDSGASIVKSAYINDDGSWESSFSISTLDQDTLQINIENIVSGFDGLVSNTNLNTSKVVQSDGKIAGFLEGYDLDGSGNIIANFDNGSSSAIAKVALYHFQNDQGLSQISGNLFQESSNSGNAIFYTDDNGKTILGSTLHNNRLESSNVQMEVAMTELIIMQKAFDASAKSITTSDEMLQRAIEMKT